MRSGRLHLSLRSIVFIWVAIALSPAKFAFADTYNVYVADNSNGDVSNLGFEGRNLVLAVNNSAYCPPPAPHCYGLFTPGAGLTTSSTSPGPIDGGNATGDYSFFLATSPNGLPFSLYVTHDGVDTFVYEGLIGDVSIDAFGDVAFESYGNADLNMLAMNESASVSTPEPSGLALLATALLAGAIFRVRRTLHRAGRADGPLIP
jgi:hypothetical protein